MSAVNTPRSGSIKTKCTVACEYCRIKRIKCNAQQPCLSCLSRGKGDLCRFPPPNIRRRKKTREKHKLLEERLQRAEALLLASGLSLDPDTAGDATFGQPAVADAGEQQVNRPSPDLQLRNSANNLEELADSLLPSGQNHRNSRSPYIFTFNDHQNDHANSPSTEVHDGDRMMPRMVPPTPVSQHSQYPPVILSPSQPLPEIDQASRPHDGHVCDRGGIQASAIMAPKSVERPDQVEFQGPGSFLSICSPAGVKWVSERTGCSNFMSSATSLASLVVYSLKLQKSSRVERVPEPDRGTACKFVQTFFKESLDSRLNLIHRPTFEARLRSHFETPEQIDSDPAWYALRNVVYAFGSRISVYKESLVMDWNKAQKHAWKYFQNAFSVHSDLVYSWSTIAAVQALFAMSLYVEGIGAPKLEYMLVSNALRIAISKGLSSQPSPAWNLTNDELEKRSWLFWSIYIAEKQISFRSRRPSAIDELDIDCPLPSSSPDGCPHKVELIRHLVSHAQITSTVMKELFSAQSRHQPLPAVVKKVKALDELLQSWRVGLPGFLKPDVSFTSSGLPPGILSDHKLLVHFSYYGTLAAIHSVLSCPWNLPRAETDRDPTVVNQIELSTQVVAGASRNSILATRSIKLDAAAPIWLSFIFPFIAALNLFTHVLQFPTLPSTQSDISLLDMAAGYFSYLEFTTRISVSFPKDMAQWARAAASRSVESLPHSDPMMSPASSIPTENRAHLLTLDEFMGGTEFGLDDWPSFFSTI